MTITFEGTHVQVLSDGDKDFEFSKQLWKRVTDLCREHDCFNVLGIADTTTPLEAVDAHEHARLFRELDIGERYRIAWVELNPEATLIVSLIESVLASRGLPGRFFSSATEAREWLLGEGSS